MRILLHLGVLCSVLMIQGGCGSGSSTGDYSQATAQGTAPLAIVDLAAHTIDYRAAVPDLASNPVYRDRQMVFRRLVAGGGEVFVAVFEITQGQWRRLAGTTPWTAVDVRICAATAQADDHPAYNLDHQAVAAAAGAWVLPGSSRLDLPTDAEWTAACGATTSAGPDGTAVARETVVNVDRLAAGGGMDAGGPSAVGSRSANELGYYDLLGNVWEWTRDGGSARGGSWFDPLRLCSAGVLAGNGAGLDAEVDHALIGARLVLRP